MSDPNDPFDVDSVPNLGPCFCDPEHNYVCPNHAPDSISFADAQDDWERADPRPRRRPDRFALWAFSISVACLILLSFGVGLGLAAGC